MKSDVRREGDLEIAQDLQAQRRVWKGQRAGWALMTLTALAALLGLTGRGPLSRRLASAPGTPLQIQYERFERSGAPSVLRFRIGPGAARDGKARLWISRRYMEAVVLEAVLPEQESVRGRRDRFEFVFEVPEPGRPATVLFHFRPEKAGGLRGAAGLTGGPALEFRQFVYP